MWKRVAVLVALGALVALGCSDNTPTEPGNLGTPLAGGGRLGDSDPFRGGPEDSGPTDSVIVDPYPYPVMTSLFYSETDCADSPGNAIIGDSATWTAWWNEATACLWRGDSTDPGSGGDSNVAWPDCNLIDTIPPCGRCYLDPPWVDFESNVVIVIRLPYDSGSWCARSLWVEDVSSEAGGTTIRYQVLTLEGGCCNMLEWPMTVSANSPVTAVLVPRPISEPVEWVREDVSTNCHWEPDPDLPLTLYYTDASCDLGPGETIITDSASFAAWLDAAWACDSARWYEFEPGSWDSLVILGDSNGGDPTSPSDPFPMPSWRSFFDVDFSQFAVLILRAGDQTRWGGGIWLNEIETASGGSIIDYAVMEPQDSCPPVNMEPSVVNPTVAIRVPLPLSEPVIWTRHTESIDCDWGYDSSWVMIDSLSPPR